MTPHTHDYEFAPLPPVDDRAARRRRRGGEGEARGGRARSGRHVGLRRLQAARESATLPGTASSCTAATRRIPTARRRDAGRARRLRLLSHPGHSASEAVLLGGARARDRDRGRERHGVPLRSGDARHLRSVEHRAAVRTESCRPRASRGGRRRCAGRARGQGRRSSTARRSRRSVCRQAWFKDPDGNALMLHRRFDA